MLEMHARNHRTRNIQLTEKTLSYEKYSGDIINTVYPNLLQTLLRNEKVLNINIWNILGDPGAASRDDEIFMGESLQQERESPWALTLTERVPEAFEIPPSDWPEKYFSGQSAKRNSRVTLMSSYTRLFSSSNAVVAWPV